MPSFSQGVKDLLNMDVDVAVINGKDYKKYINDILELSEKCLVVLDLPSHNIKDAINDFISFIPAEEKQEPDLSSGEVYCGGVRDVL